MISEILANPLPQLDSIDFEALGRGEEISTHRASVLAATDAYAALVPASLAAAPPSSTSPLDILNLLQVSVPTPDAAAIAFASRGGACSCVRVGGRDRSARRGGAA